MKTIGGLMLVLSGLIWGLNRSAELRRRVEMLTELLGLVKLLKAEIYYSSRPIAELLALSDSHICRTARQLPGFASDPAGALAQAGRQLFSDPQDRELLAGFAAGLGASDTQGTMEHLGLYSALTGARLEEARQQQEQKRRLYPALGLFSTLALTILII